MRPMKPLERAWTQPDLWLIASLIVAVMLLYVAGVAAERATCASAGVHTGAPCAGQEAGGGQDHDADAGARAAPETVLGVPIEDPSVVAAVVVGWLLLAAAVVGLGRPLLPALVLIAGGAAVFDVVEVVHHLTEARFGIATLAAIVALGHLAILALAVLALTRAGPHRITSALHQMAARLSTAWHLLSRQNRT